MWKEILQGREIWIGSTERWKKAAEESSLITCFWIFSRDISREVTFALRLRTGGKRATSGYESLNIKIEDCVGIEEFFNAGQMGFSFRASPFYRISIF